MTCKSCVFFGIDNYCNYRDVYLTDLSLCDDFEEVPFDDSPIGPDCFSEGDLE